MDISNEIEETIKAADLESLAVEFSENLLDLAMDENIIKEIPLFGSILGIGKGVMSISDRLFTKKLFNFLYQIKDLSSIERNQQIIKIQQSSKYQSRIGEKLLMIIDKCNDAQKASWIGKLFYHCLRHEINYADFLSCSEIINRASIDSILDVIGNSHTEIPLDSEDDMISSGLFRIKSPVIEIKKFENTHQHYREGEDLRTDYKINDPEWSAVITKWALIIRKYLTNVANSK